MNIKIFAGATIIRLQSAPVSLLLSVQRKIESNGDIIGKFLQVSLFTYKLYNQ